MEMVEGKEECVKEEGEKEERSGWEGEEEEKRWLL